MRLLSIDGAHHLLAFFNRVHDGLLHVGVLAGMHRINEHLLMPVVGAADDDRIDILAVEQLVVIEVGFGIRAGNLQCLVASRSVNVADGHQINRGIILEELHQVLAAPTGAHGADTDLVIRAQHARRRQTAEHGRRGARHGCLLQEISSSNSCFFCHELAPPYGFRSQDSGVRSRVRIPIPKSSPHPILSADPRGGRTN